MALISPPRIVRLLTGKYICWSRPGNDPVLYLTFDDGPQPDVTPAVLDILQEHAVKATFFCIGKNVEAHHALYERIISEGHAVGNHTWSHLNGWKCSLQEYVEDVNRCTGVIDTRLFRPPYGRIRLSQAKFLAKHYRIYGWSVLSRDYDARETPEQCMKNCTDTLRNGSLIVFHDSLKAKENVIGALPGFLKAAKEKGYRFDVLSA